MPALNPAEVSSALPGASAFDVLDAHLVTGGYPRLVVDLRRSGLPVREWIRESLMDDLSPLVASGRLTLDAEFPDSDSAYRVLSAIGGSDTARLGLGEIGAAIADPGAAIKTVETFVLRALKLLVEEQRLVERELPAWSTSTRLRRNRITDPYLQFWFRYVERQVDTIARGRGDIAFAAFERDWSSWRGQAVEPLVRRALEQLGATDPRLRGVETVLPWWTRDGQVEVDVVGADRERTLLLGSIKWRPTRGVSAREMSDLAALKSRVPRSADAALAAICPSGELSIKSTRYMAGRRLVRVM